MLDAVDLFAGAGGFTEGATQAGFNVVAAANHWPLAVEIHAHNHPQTNHVCQDLNQADFTKFPRHGTLIGSPACQGHTKARGKDKPHHDECRSTAWAPVACAEVHRPELVVIENVPEMLQWVLFSAWKLAWEKLGYALSTTVLDAADYGVPQHRERLVVVCTRSKAPLLLNPPKQSRLSARSFIDFDAGKWSPIHKPGRAAATLAQVAAAKAQFGPRCLIAYYGEERKAGRYRGRSLDEPIGTIVTKDRFGVIDGDRMRMLTVEEARRAMGFPASYTLPKQRTHAIKMLGNAVPPPLARAVLGYLKAVA